MDIKKIPLLYNAQAHFAGAARFPDGGLMHALSDGGMAGFEALCWAFAECATQAELVRRRAGHDKGTVWTAEDVALEMLPIQIADARGSLMDAISKGLTVPDHGEEVDEVLQALQKKTKRK